LKDIPALKKEEAQLVNGLTVSILILSLVSSLGEGRRVKGEMMDPNLLIPPSSCSPRLGLDGGMKRNDMNERTMKSSRKERK
jgi:hypothetical protein